MLTMEKRKEAVVIGRVKRLIEAGYDKEEIAKTLGRSIEEIDAYEKIVIEAEANKNKIES